MLYSPQKQLIFMLTDPILLQNLPDEALQNILDQSRIASLKALSTVNKQFCYLVTPALFCNLDISVYNAPQCTKLWSRLFDPQRGTTRFRDLHFKKLRIQLNEALLVSVERYKGNSEFDCRFRAACKVFQAVSSVERLEIDICIGDSHYVLEAVDDGFLKAIDQLGREAQNKAQKIHVSIDALSLDEYAEAKTKTAAIVARLPQNLTTSILLSGVDINSEILIAKSREKRHFLTGRLHALVLNACIGPSIVSAPTHLDTLTLSWSESFTRPHAGLEVAFQIMAATSETLLNVCL